jgi:exopolysaccharide biosynthesis WecB/TagA/CpsF family protein
MRRLLSIGRLDSRVVNNVSMIGSSKLQVGPLRLSCFSEQELLNEVFEYTNAKRGCIITYAHLHTLALAKKDEAVAKIINCCDICYCDGIGVSYMSILTNGKWLPKVTANNFVDKFADLTLVHSFKIAIIGGRPETMSKAKEYFIRRGALIVYSRDGYFNEAQGDSIRQEIVNVEPDIILIGMGQDSQEKFAFSLKQLLPRTVLFCVGGLFSFIAGEEWPCPIWMRKIGLEWAIRLASSPHRLWRRYLLEGPSLLLRAMVWRKL